MLPSPNWINWEKGEFLEGVERHLTETNGMEMHPTVPFASTSKRKTIERKIIQAPLLVRLPNHTKPPSSMENSTSASAPGPLSPYTPAGRSALLSSIGVPSQLHPAGNCKILVVSFGGQKFRRVGSRAPSRTTSPAPPHSPTKENLDPNNFKAKRDSKRISLTNLVIPSPIPLSPYQSRVLPRSPHTPSSTHSRSQSDPLAAGSPFHPMGISPRLATSSHLFIPGAPPASKPSATPTSPKPGSPLSKAVFTAKMIPPSVPGTPRDGSPRLDQGSSRVGASPRQSLGHKEKSSSLSSYHSHSYFPLAEHANSILTSESPIISPDLQPEPRGLLPDSSWIAIVCGVSKEQWNTMDENGDEGLPEGFYVAPKDVYMPDLTAIADVLLGKLVSSLINPSDF